MIWLITVIWRFMVGDLQEWEQGEHVCNCATIGRQRRLWARKWWMRFENTWTNEQGEPTDYYCAGGGAVARWYSPAWAKPLDWLHFLIFGPAPKLRRINGGDIPPNPSTLRPNGEPPIIFDADTTESVAMQWQAERGGPRYIGKIDGGPDHSPDAIPYITGGSYRRVMPGEKFETGSVVHTMALGSGSATARECIADEPRTPDGQYR